MLGWFLICDSRHVSFVWGQILDKVHVKLLTGDRVGLFTLDLIPVSDVRSD